MKNKYLSSIVVLMIAGCSLDTRFDILYTQENINSDYSKVQDLGYAGYTNMLNGFWGIDNNISAPMSDEAEQTAPTSRVQMFNEGSWNAFDNPDNQYSYLYEGIRKVNYFLEYSVDYKNLLAHNRDTLTDNAYQYKLDVENIKWMRAESHVLRAYYYFELAKRYGGVPLITKSLTIGQDAPPVPRASFDKLVEYMISEIDFVIDSLQVDWKEYDSQRDGRFTKGAALALKSRILLYAASPLYSTTNNKDRWKAAAAAANDVIKMNKYSLDVDYKKLFMAATSVTSREVIMAYRLGSTNELEIANYPIGTPGGKSGVTPSHNLVAAYEYKGIPDPDNPYANRDPRLDFSIVTNGSTWNKRPIEIYVGGKDDYTLPNTSKTGYYLKKYLADNLYLLQGQVVVRSWIMFRYAETLLNYAEAMNEAYGPDDNNGYGLSARQAINLVRNRTGVNMPDVVAVDYDDMKKCIKHERRIELAFEDHRYWDLRRWKDAEVALNAPLMGIRANIVDGVTKYAEVEVEKRKFIAPKMYYHPIPQSEVDKTKNVVSQNEGW